MRWKINCSTPDAFPVIAPPKRLRLSTVESFVRERVPFQLSSGARVFRIAYTRHVRVRAAHTSCSSGSSVDFLKHNRRKTGSTSIIGIVASVALALAVAVSATLSGDSGATSDSTISNDAIAKLGRRLADGSASLEYGGDGYLSSLLHLLGINVDSQVLVFSKTSFQHALINPKNPRAVYFNDNVAIGMVPGGTVYEMVALEP